MPRNKPNESIEGNELDDVKEPQRRESVGKRGNEYEDIEQARQTQRNPSVETDEEELTEDDLIEIDDGVDLDRVPENQGPDA